MLALAGAQVHGRSSKLRQAPSQFEEFKEFIFWDGVRKVCLVVFPGTPGADISEALRARLGVEPSRQFVVCFRNREVALTSALPHGVELEIVWQSSRKIHQRVMEEKPEKQGCWSNHMQAPEIKEELRNRVKKIRSGELKTHRRRAHQLEAQLGDINDDMQSQLEIESDAQARLERADAEQASPWDDLQQCEDEILLVRDRFDRMRAEANRISELCTTSISSLSRISKYHKRLKMKADFIRMSNDAVNKSVRSVAELNEIEQEEEDEQEEEEVEDEDDEEADAYDYEEEEEDIDEDDSDKMPPLTCESRPAVPFLGRQCRQAMPAPLHPAPIKHRWQQEDKKELFASQTRLGSVRLHDKRQQEGRRDRLVRQAPFRGAQMHDRHQAQHREAQICDLQQRQGRNRQQQEGWEDLPASQGEAEEVEEAEEAGEGEESEEVDELEEAEEVHVQEAEEPALELEAVRPQPQLKDLDEEKALDVLRAMLVEPLQASRSVIDPVDDVGEVSRASPSILGRGKRVKDRRACFAEKEVEIREVECLDVAPQVEEPRREPISWADKVRGSCADSDVFTRPGTHDATSSICSASVRRGREPPPPQTPLPSNAEEAEAMVKPPDQQPVTFSAASSSNSEPWAGRDGENWVLVRNVAVRSSGAIVSLVGGCSKAWLPADGIKPPCAKHSELIRQELAGTFKVRFRGSGEEELPEVSMWSREEEEDMPSSVDKEKMLWEQVLRSDFNILRDNLDPSRWLPGRVKNIKAYGVFVNLSASQDVLVPNGFIPTDHMKVDEKGRQVCTLVPGQAVRVRTVKYQRKNEKGIYIFDCTMLPEAVADRSGLQKTTTCAKGGGSFGVHKVRETDSEADQAGGPSAAAGMRTRSGKRSTRHPALRNG